MQTEKALPEKNLCVYDKRMTHHVWHISKGINIIIAIIGFGFGVFFNSVAPPEVSLDWLVGIRWEPTVRHGSNQGTSA